ncbi:hypothetical protein CRE_13446 [Caenorhabditis remanei]|uniref:RING-type domain-containing protein n=1 Tax=Caenorhabditis remanei TaxID=31234 RepID=E3MR08_CAERE|nr:hypothetical protein CRE_13446 [Caenorhabditis remanei]
MGGLHLTEISHHFNLFITISIAIFLFSFGGFDFKSKYHWRIFYATLFTISLISCLIGILKSWTICRNGKNQTGVLERCKRDYTIGSGGLLLFACIPYFVICYFHFNIKLQIALYVFFVFNISSVVLHYAFISKLKRLCRLKYKGSHCVIATCFHLLVLISIFTFKVVFDRQIAFVILCFQLTFLYALIFNTITLWTVLGNRIELMNIEMRIIENGEAGDDRTPMGTNVREQDSSETGDPHEVCCSEIDETSPREIDAQATCLKCDLCMLEYDKTIQQQTPLIPTSCGHVLCHKCINIIMNQYDQQHFYCPFCQSCG